MPRVYMRFEWLPGWRVSFLDGSKVLPQTLLFRSDEKLLEMAGKVVRSRAWPIYRLWSMRWGREEAAYTSSCPIRSSLPCSTGEERNALGSSVSTLEMYSILKLGEFGDREVEPLVRELRGGVQRWIDCQEARDFCRGSVLGAE